MSPLASSISEFTSFIDHHGEMIPYRVICSRRKTRISITAHEDGTITVRAPLGLSREEICRKVEVDRDWIIRQVGGVARNKEPRLASGTLTVHGVQIPYTVDYSTRRTKNTVVFYHDGRLEAQMRSDATSDDVLDTIAQNRDWVYRQVLQASPSKGPKEWVGMVEHLGYPIPFRVTYSLRATQLSVKISEDRQVLVVAPVGMEEPEITQIVQDQAARVHQYLTASDKHPLAEGVVRVGEASITYHIRESSRATRVTLKVKPDRSVEVIAPPGTDPSFCHAFVREKSDWIFKHLVASVRPVPAHHRYRDGDILQYQGKPVKISVERGSIKVTTSYKEGMLLVKIPDNTPPDLEEMYIRSAVKQVFELILAADLPRMVDKYAKVLNVPAPRVKLRLQKSKWGVCTPHGITFNIRLGFAPPEVAEYIVVHEICHLVHHNHSPAFWGLVERLLPDYRARKERLKQEGHLWDF
jgi:hypothetical protein